MAIAMYFGKPVVADAPAQLSEAEYKTEWVKLMSSRPFSFPEGIAQGVAHWLVSNGLETYDDFRCNFTADTDYAKVRLRGTAVGEVPGASGSHWCAAGTLRCS